MIMLLAMVVGLAVGAIFERSSERTAFPGWGGYHPGVPDHLRIIRYF